MIVIGLFSFPLWIYAEMCGSFLYAIEVGDGINLKVEKDDEKNNINLPLKRTGYRVQSSIFLNSVGFVDSESPIKLHLTRWLCTVKKKISELMCKDAFSQLILLMLYNWFFHLESCMNSLILWNIFIFFFGHNSIC